MGKNYEAVMALRKKLRGKNKKPTKEEEEVAKEEVAKEEVAAKRASNKKTAK